MCAPDLSPWNDKLIIETPEQTSLEYPLSGVGSRCLALLLDTLIQICALLILLAINYYAMSRLAGGGRGTPLLWVQAIIYFGVFVLFYGYYAIFEALWNGQTPGKRWVRLRVIQESGKPIQVWQAIARNLMRIIDSIPFFYAVGLASALLSRKNRRLGDFVAGTVVVHERPLEKIDVGWAGSVATTASVTAAGPMGAARLNLDEVRLIEAFLERRNSLDFNVRGRMANHVAARITLRLNMDMEQRRNAGLLSDETFLEAVARERLGARLR